jgi:ribosome-associated protein
MKTQNTINIALENLLNEVNFSTARSGGKGGQNVNKVETKVVVYWHPEQSALLNDNEKKTLLLALATYLNKEGEVVMSCDTYRTQLDNKEEVLRRLKQKIKTALTPKKKRQKTSIPKAVKEKRLESKKQQSSIKQLRKKVSL